MHPRRIPLLILLSTVVAAGPLAAQSTFEIGPVVGYYRPTGSFNTSIPYFAAVPEHASDLATRSWGVEARYWLAARWGVEARVAVAGKRWPGRQGFLVPLASPCAYPGCGPGQFVPPTPVTVSTASALLLCDVSPAPKRWRAWLAAGPAVVRHGGAAYEPYGSPVQWAGVVGLGGSVPLVAHLRATAGLAATMYAFRLRLAGGPDFGPTELQNGFQTDLLLHLGLDWSWR